MDKYKRLANNTVIFTIGSFGAKVLNLILIRFYSSIFSQAEYSRVEIILQTIYFVLPLATICIAESVLRFSLDKTMDRKSVYSVGFFTITVGLIIIGLFFPILGLFKDFKGLVGLTFLCTAFSAYRTLNQQYIRATGYLKLFALDGIITTVILVIVSIINLKVLDLGVKGYIMAILISDILSNIFIIYFADIKKDISLKRFFNRPLVIGMYKYAIPLIPTFILWWAVAGSDKYLVRIMQGEDANGIYSAAYKIPMLLSILSTIFFQAWQISAIDEYDNKESKRFYTKVFDGYLSLMFIASAGLIMFSKLLTLILLDNKFSEAYLYMPFLILGTILMGAAQFLSSIYNATKNSKNSLYTSILAAVMNFVLNMILIPWLGIQGACFSTMISYLVCFLVRIVDTQRFLKYGVSWNKIGVNLFLTLVMIINVIFKFNHSFIISLIFFMFIFIINFSALEETIKKILKK